MEERRAKFEVRVWLARKIQRHLPKAEQVKVVDQQRGHEHQREAQTEHGVNGVANHRIGEVPNDAADRLPEDEQRYQSMECN